MLLDPKEYELGYGDEIPESETDVGRIKFQVSPYNYSYLDRVLEDIFPNRIILNVISGRLPQGIFIRCTLGACANYVVEGTIKKPNGVLTLRMTIGRKY